MIRRGNVGREEVDERKKVSACSSGPSRHCQRPSPFIEESRHATRSMVPKNWTVLFGLFSYDGYLGFHSFPSDLFDLFVPPGRLRLEIVSLDPFRLLQVLRFVPLLVHSYRLNRVLRL